MPNYRVNLSLPECEADNPMMAVESFNAQWRGDVDQWEYVVEDESTGERFLVDMADGRCRPYDRHDPQWQRWTVTIPAGRHGSLMTTAEFGFDAFVRNVYSDEAAMRALVERAGCEAVREYADPTTEQPSGLD